MSIYSVKQQPAILNLEIDQGNDFLLTITLSRDITLYTFDTYFINSGVIVPIILTVLDASTGQISLFIPGTSTAEIDGNNSWIFRWIDGDGYTRDVLTGVLKVDKNV